MTKRDDSLIGRRALSLRARAIVLCALVAAALVSACTEQAFIEHGSPDPSFGGTEAGAASPDASDGAARLCATNECREGRTSCSNRPFPCAVDLLSDNDNCGVCGHRCPRDQAFFQSYGGLTECVDGTCRLVCTPDTADCNGLLEDGCELDTRSDKNNCGGCGIVCSDVCNQGTCGCEPGLTFCSDACVNLDISPRNCGECGLVCPPSTDLPPPSWHATRTCARSECNQLVCIVEPSSEVYPKPRVWSDCNGNLGDPAGDGCEVELGNDANCGGCGKTCAPGEICRATTSGGECFCPCGSSCFDVDSDVDNCGSCGFVCTGDRRSIDPGLWLLGGDPDPAHGKPICDQGVCDYRCSPHWADCDGNSQNGCETNLMEDPINCGGCGVRCQAAEGQPCIEGRCAAKECEGVR